MCNPRNDQLAKEVSVESEHLEYMKLAIVEARKSVPEDNRPHPKVGAVVVRDGQLLASGHRGEKPEEHAEYHVLEQKLKEEAVAGATVYTTLEPCTTRNPPKVCCAMRLKERKVARVFIGMLDPDERIRGLGIIALRDANIDVQFFPKELAAEIEELNREFIRSKQNLPAKQNAHEVALYEELGLDNWYSLLNRTYWDRNFHRDANAIFTHLVEVVGGLSLLASSKKKVGVDSDEFVAKAIAWWLALCGKVGVRSVEELIWRKFPAVCPYCMRIPHDSEECLEQKRARPGPNWERLTTIGSANLEKMPKNIGDWQRLFQSLYPVQQTEEYGPIFARLTEELGELAEAIRVFPAAPGYFLSEAADVFAWIMHLQNLKDSRANVTRDGRGRALGNAFANSYPGGCKDCREKVCRCPPILKNTVGRIAHEVPTAASKGFMTIDEAQKLFSE